MSKIPDIFILAYTSLFSYLFQISQCQTLLLCFIFICFPFYFINFYSLKFCTSLLLSLLFQSFFVCVLCILSLLLYIHKYFVVVFVTHRRFMLFKKNYFTFMHLQIIWRKSGRWIWSRSEISELEKHVYILKKVLYYKNFQQRMTTPVGSTRVLNCCTDTANAFCEERN